MAPAPARCQSPEPGSRSHCDSLPTSPPDAGRDHAQPLNSAAIRTDCGSRALQLVVLLAGLIVGVLGGPMVLGRIAPSVYQSIFVGGAQQRAQLVAHDDKTQQLMDALTTAGATAAAISELAEQRRDERAVLVAQVEQVKATHANAVAGYVAAVLLALVAVTVLEDLVGDRSSTIQGRLVLMRHLLLGLWLASVIALPGMLTHTQLWAVIVILLAVFAIVLAPVRRHDVAVG